SEQNTRNMTECLTTNELLPQFEDTCVKTLDTATPFETRRPKCTVWLWLNETTQEVRRQRRRAGRKWKKDNLQGGGGAGAYLQQSVGERRGHPGQVASPSKGNTDRQDKQPVAPKSHLDQFVKQSCIWTLGGSWSTQGGPTHASGEHSEKPPTRGEPRTFFLQGNSAANCTILLLFLMSCSTCFSTVAHCG
ncbi:hypothetical protein ILYODFUR_016049, partial [Ilyodon furcidens]